MSTYRDFEKTQSASFKRSKGLIINESSSHYQPRIPSTSTRVTVTVDNNDDSIPVSFRSVLAYPQYRRWLLYLLLLFTAFYERAVFLSGYGAAYFAGCKTIKENNDCPKDFNFDKFNQYYQLSLSMAAGFSFFCAPIVGTLSDRFGRKPFLLLQLLICVIPYIFIMFDNNMKTFLFLYSLVGLNGASSTGTPVTSAYISDVLPQKLHIVGYALVYLLSGIGLFIAAIIGYVISSVFNDHFNFYVITALYGICLIYLVTLIEEPVATKTTLTKKQNNNINPCHSFTYCCDNKIVFWVSLLCGLVSLPAIGLIDIATIVLADNFDADSNDKYNNVAVLYLVGWSVGLIVGPVVVLPILRKYFIPFNIFIVTVFVLILAVCSFMVICMFKLLWTIPITSFILGIGFLCFAPLRSILTKYTDTDKRGNAFGAMFAFSAVCNIIAPTGFAFCYHYLKKIHAPGLIFAVSLVMLLIALIFAIGLKTTINQIEKDKNKHSDIFLDVSQ